MNENSKENVVDTSQRRNYVVEEGGDDINRSDLSRLVEKTSGDLSASQKFSELPDDVQFANCPAPDVTYGSSGCSFGLSYNDHNYAVEFNGSGSPPFLPIEENPRISPGGYREVVLDEFQSPPPIPVRVRTQSTGSCSGSIVGPTTPGQTVVGNVIRCVCCYTHDDGKMVQCSKCSVWQHFDCVSTDNSNFDKSVFYECEECCPRSTIDYRRAVEIQRNKRASSQTTSIHNSSLGQLVKRINDSNKYPTIVVSASQVSCPIIHSRQLIVTAVSSTLPTEKNVSTSLSSCTIVNNTSTVGRVSKRKQTLAMRNTGSSPPDQPCSTTMSTDGDDRTSSTHPRQLSDILSSSLLSHPQGNTSRPSESLSPTRPHWHNLVSPPTIVGHPTSRCVSPGHSGAYTQSRPTCVYPLRPSHQSLTQSRNFVNRIPSAYRSNDMIDRTMLSSSMNVSSQRNQYSSYDRRNSSTFDSSDIEEESDLSDVSPARMTHVNYKLSSNLKPYERFHENGSSGFRRRNRHYQDDNSSSSDEDDFHSTPVTMSESKMTISTAIHLFRRTMTTWMQKEYQEADQMVYSEEVERMLSRFNENGCGENQADARIRERLKLKHCRLVSLASRILQKNNDSMDCLIPMKSTWTPIQAWRVLESTHSLRKYDTVIEFKGRMLLKSEFERDIDQTKYLNPFVLFYEGFGGSDLCLNASNYGNDARFIRRSCSPNCDIGHLTEGGRLHLIVRALCDIPIGTELTIGFDFDYKMAPYVECGCCLPSDQCAVKQYALSTYSSNVPRSLTESRRGHSRRNQLSSRLSPRTSDTNESFCRRLETSNFGKITRNRELSYNRDWFNKDNDDHHSNESMSESLSSYSDTSDVEPPNVPVSLPSKLFSTPRDKESKYDVIRDGPKNNELLGLPSSNKKAVTKNCAAMRSEKQDMNKKIEGDSSHSFSSYSMSAEEESPECNQSGVSPFRMSTQNNRSLMSRASRDRATGRATSKQPRVKSAVCPNKLVKNRRSTDPFTQKTPKALRTYTPKRDSKTKVKFPAFSSANAKRRISADANSARSKETKPNGAVEFRRTMSVCERRPSNESKNEKVKPNKPKNSEETTETSPRKMSRDDRWLAAILKRIDEQEVGSRKRRQSKTSVSSSKGDCDDNVDDLESSKDNDDDKLANEKDTKDIIAVVKDEPEIDDGSTDPMEDNSDYEKDIAELTTDVETIDTPKVEAVNEDIVLGTPCFKDEVEVDKERREIEECVNVIKDEVAPEEHEKDRLDEVEDVKENLDEVEDVKEKLDEVEDEQEKLEEVGDEKEKLKEVGDEKEKLKEDKMEECEREKEVDEIEVGNLAEVEVEELAEVKEEKLTEVQEEKMVEIKEEADEVIASVEGSGEDHESQSQMEMSNEYEIENVTSHQSSEPVISLNSSKETLDASLLKHVSDTGENDIIEASFDDEKIDDKPDVKEEVNKRIDEEMDATFEVTESIKETAVDTSVGEVPIIESSRTENLGDVISLVEESLALSTPKKDAPSIVDNSPELNKVASDHSEPPNSSSMAPMPSPDKRKQRRSSFKSQELNSLIDDQDSFKKSLGLTDANDDQEEKPARWLRNALASIKSQEKMTQRRQRRVRRKEKPSSVNKDEVDAMASLVEESGSVTVSRTQSTDDTVFHDISSESVDIVIKEVDAETGESNTTPLASTLETHSTPKTDAPIDSVDSFERPKSVCSGKRRRSNRRISPEIKPELKDDKVSPVKEVALEVEPSNEELTLPSASAKAFGASEGTEDSSVSSDDSADDDENRTPRQKAASPVTSSPSRCLSRRLRSSVSGATAGFETPVSSSRGRSRGRPRRSSGGRFSVDLLPNSVHSNDEIVSNVNNLPDKVTPEHCDRIVYSSQKNPLERFARHKSQILPKPQLDLPVIKSVVTQASTDSETPTSATPGGEYSAPLKKRWRNYTCSDDSPVPATDPCEQHLPPMKKRRLNLDSELNEIDTSHLITPEAAVEHDIDQPELESTITAEAMVPNKKADGDPISDNKETIEVVEGVLTSNVSMNIDVFTSVDDTQVNTPISMPRKKMFLRHYEQEQQRISQSSGDPENVDKEFISTCETKSSQDIVLDKDLSHITKVTAEIHDTFGLETEHEKIAVSMEPKRPDKQLLDALLTLYKASENQPLDETDPVKPSVFSNEKEDEAIGPRTPSEPPEEVLDEPTECVEEWSEELQNVSDIDANEAQEVEEEKEDQATEEDEVMKEAQLLKRIHERDRQIMDMQELKSLERRKAKLEAQLRYMVGKDVQNAETTGNRRPEQAVVSASPAVQSDIVRFTNHLRDHLERLRSQLNQPSTSAVNVPSCSSSREIKTNTTNEIRSPVVEKMRSRSRSPICATSPVQSHRKSAVSDDESTASSSSNLSSADQSRRHKHRHHSHKKRRHHRSGHRHRRRSKHRRKHKRYRRDSSSSVEEVTTSKPVADKELEELEEFHEWPDEENEEEDDEEKQSVFWNVDGAPVRHHFREEMNLFPYDEHIPNDIHPDAFYDRGGGDVPLMAMRRFPTPQFHPKGPLDFHQRVWYQRGTGNRFRRRRPFLRHPLSQAAAPMPGQWETLPSPNVQHPQSVSSLSLQSQNNQHHQLQSQLPPHPLPIQVQSHPGRLRPVPHCGRGIVRHRGPSGLHRGTVSPSAANVRQYYGSNLNSRRNWHHSMY